jgi:hypothetical protein
MAKREPKKLEHVRVERMPLADLKLLDLNARFMPHEQFQRLVENLRRDGQLTSVPFAWKQRNGSYLVLSGNHRVQAAIEAGIDEGYVMLCDDPMPKSRRVALQLAHNAIAGEDDPATLKALYDGLEDIDWRQYAGLDDKTLQLLDEVQLGSLSEAHLDFQTVTITFLPSEKERAEKAWEVARTDLTGADEVWLARFEESERTLDALDTAGRAYGVTNAATALMIVLDIFERNVRELQDGYLAPDGEAHEGKRMVPTATVVGQEITAGAASVIQRAIARMIERDEAGTPGQAIELLAADYLSGA